MKSLSLPGARRSATTKQAVKKLRAENKIPCVLYGGKENIHFEAPEMEFKKLVYTPSVYLVDLVIDGNPYPAILKDVQYHPVTDAILHADFMEIQPDKEVQIRIPVRLTGSSEGVKEGGQLVHKLRKVHVSALPDRLPDEIELDITPLMIGDSIRISNLEREGVTFLDPPSNMIVGVRVARAVVEETPAATVPAEGAEVPAEGGEAPAAEAGKEAAKEPEKK